MCQLKHSIKSNHLIFLFRVSHVYKDLNEDKITLFSADYLSIIEHFENSWSNHKSVNIEKEFLAHLFGMSFLILRGMISTKLAHTKLGRYGLPLINPMEHLKRELRSDGPYFIVPSQGSGEEE